MRFVAREVISLDRWQEGYVCVYLLPDESHQLRTTAVDRTGTSFAINQTLVFQARGDCFYMVPDAGPLRRIMPDPSIINEDCEIGLHAVVAIYVVTQRKLLNTSFTTPLFSLLYI